VHGFGLATARALFEDGARVVVTSRSSERAEEVAAAYAIGIGCDLLAADGAARLFGESTKRVGKIDILVLNGPGPAPGTAAATLLDVAVIGASAIKTEHRWRARS
jgi:3-oxoacyl-[acyl-carrier protein] reductase